ncbi:HD domain-containing protein [Aliarcobacter cryaerophilus]|uniref:HD domain-containing protein n=1 Tax=Aliarcobacter cryaerophilus TaxID=28198 RepID=UPI003DA66366
MKTNEKNKLSSIKLFNSTTSYNSEFNELMKEIKKDPLFQDIINSKTFNRLKYIAFLGAIDYLYKNKKRHTRYEHTLSVASLALKYAKLKFLKEEDKKYLICAALLHDIGHGPLSHSMEPSFKKIFNLSHHQAGINIIYGNSPLGSELFNILKKYNIDINKVIDLINGESKETYAFALSNPINIDTIDGIIRTYTYLCNSRNKNKELMKLPTIFEILEATITPSKSDILDKFWLLKDKVYNQIINYRLHMYADNISQYFIEENAKYISSDDFYLDDIKFRKQYEILFSKLNNLKSKNQNEILEKDLTFIKRKYKVNYDIKLNDINDIEKKYTHTKKHEIISFKNLRIEKMFQKRISYI